MVTDFLRIRIRLKLALIMIGAAIALPALAHEYFTPGFTLIHPWAEASQPGANSATVYFTVDNVTAGDRLISASSVFAEHVDVESAKGANRAGPAGPAGPATAGTAEIVIAPDADKDFGPNGSHLVLRGLREPLQWGRSYGMTLVFEKSGPLSVMISIGAH